MWLPKWLYFRSSEQPNKDNKDKANEPQQIKKSINDDDQQIVSSNAVVDFQQETRYDQYTSTRKNDSFQFPSNALHTTQYIQFYKDKMFHARINSDSTQTLITIMLTDRQILITPNIFQTVTNNSLVYYSISYGSIQKCEILYNKKKIPQSIKILLKDNRQLYLTPQTNTSLSQIPTILNKFAFVKGVNKFYAFRYGSQNYYKQDKWNGWQIYNIKHQFKRQGLIIFNQNQFNLRYIQNYQGQFCSTYPQLLVIPTKITDDQLRKCSQFRTKQRFPALTYFYQYKDNQYSALFRCSQNKVGVRNARSKQDELMIQYIGDLTGSFLAPSEENKKQKNCKIYDARGYYSALGNRFVGKGYQNTQFYTNCQINWLNIPNIHAVRQSYQQMMNYRQYNSNFFYTCAQSKWYNYLYLIIDGAKSIAKDLISGTNVIVHCSDGWDRTSQLCALSQLIIDPYYRTIQGLAVLIEKDWRHFGHKFRERTAQYNAVEYYLQQKSPIFLQFLDCIYQIMEQFPLSFQYNESLLLFLAKNVDSNIYGTFMANNIKQSKYLRIRQNTISIWSQIYQKRQLYLNPYYMTNIDESWLDVGIEQKYMTIWRSLFLGDYSQINYIQKIMKSESEVQQSLQKKRISNQQVIQKLQQQLKKLQQNDKQI